MILAEPVGADISLDLEQLRDHLHHGVNVDDKPDDRQVPSKKKKKKFPKCIKPRHLEETPKSFVH